MGAAVAQDLTDDGLVSEPHDVVEVLAGVVGVAAGMRATQDGGGAAASE